MLNADELYALGLSNKFYSNFSSFPDASTSPQNKLYIDENNGVIYRNNGTAYVQVSSSATGTNYLGVWDADLNSPTLQSGVGVAGDFYKVSVAGNTNLDGETNWEIDDTAQFNGTVWQRVPATNIDNTPIELSGSQSITQLGTVYLINATVADATITIPDADATNGGKFVQIIKNSGNFNVIVQTTTNQNIGGSASQTIQNADEAITVVSRDGDSSWVISQDSRKTNPQWGEIEGTLTNQSDLSAELAKTYTVVADIAERDSIPTELLTTGKIVLVEDIGDGTDEMYRWNGSSFEVNAFDSVRFKDGGRIQAEDGQVALEFVETGDDRGIMQPVGQYCNETGEIIAGFDSSPVTLAFLYDTANESGTTITGATDILSIVESDSGSTTPLFDDNLAGQVIIVGYEVPFYGVKMKYGNLGILEPENVIGEYLNNLDTWNPALFMVTNANPPATSAGWELASFTQEHVRFGQSLNPDNVNDWEARTLNINGTNYTRYFARLRLITPITAIPLVEQIKQHPSRIELNSGSVIEFFGDSRCSFTLQSGPRILINNPESSPANENVNYMNSTVDGDGLTVQGLDNEFDDGTVDNSMIVISFVEALDTSTPLLITLSYHPSNNNAGQIEFIAEYIQVQDDFVYNQGLAPDGVVSVTDTIPSGTDNVRRTLSFEIPINEIGSAGGGVVIGLSRDARGSNANDTYSGDVIITNCRVDGRRWRT